MMKHSPMPILLRVLVCLLLNTMATQVHADFGSIILHKAKFVLKNGSSVTAYVPISDYSRRIEDYQDMSKDKAFQKLLNQYFFVDSRVLKFKVFKKYHTFTAPSKYNPTNREDFTYTDSASVCTLHLDSIKYTVYLGNQNKPSLMWKQIEVFDQTTVELMKSHSFKHYKVVSLVDEDFFFLDAHVFCFNTQLNEAAFNQALKNFGSSVPAAKRGSADSYRKEIQALEKQGIVVFFWAEGSC